MIGTYRFRSQIAKHQESFRNNLRSTFAAAKWISPNSSHRRWAEPMAPQATVVSEMRLKMVNKMFATKCPNNLPSLRPIGPNARHTNTPRAILSPRMEYKALPPATFWMINCRQRTKQRNNPARRVWNPDISFQKGNSIQISLRSASSKVRIAPAKRTNASFSRNF